MKNLWAFLLLIILPSLCHGQIQIGVKGGYHYFWFSHPEDGHYVSCYNYPNDGFVVGASICQRLLNSFNPGIEIIFRRSQM
jgi:hypothetical protein